VARATNQVVWRVLVFYVLAVFLIVCVVPWNDTKLGDSPFIAALERIGIPGSADIMNAIVVAAVLSCLNSGIYVASRMLFASRGAAMPRSGSSSSTAAACRWRRSCCRSAWASSR
jgi:GABA permease